MFVRRRILASFISIQMPGRCKHPLGEGQAISVAVSWKESNLVRTPLPTQIFFSSQPQYGMFVDVEWCVERQVNPGLTRRISQYLVCRLPVASGWPWNKQEQQDSGSVD